MAELGKLIVYGAGGHGLVVAEAAEAAGWVVLGFVDDNEDVVSPLLKKWRMLEREVIDGSESSVIVAVGENSIRREIQEKLVKRGISLATVVHPSAVVSGSAVVGEGVFVSANAVVNGMAEIGNGAIVNTSAVVEHHCAVGDFVHVGPGAVLCGGVSVGDMTLVGAGATVRPGVRVGRDVTVGINAAIVSDVADGVRVVGVPGKEIK